MNRDDILTTIDRHLQDRHRESMNVRPLGEVVAEVAAEIRAGSNGQASPAAAEVIPIEQVAAFVEGNVEPSEADTVCQAMMVDNSVLAEVVAAMEARRVPVEQLPALPAGLSQRLLAMNSDAASDRVPESPAESPSLSPVIELRTEAAATSPDDTAARRQRRRILMGLLALAAMIAVAVFVLGRGADQAPDRSTVVRNVEVAPQPDPPEAIDIEEGLDSLPERIDDTNIAENPPPASMPIRPDLIEVPESDPFDLSVPDRPRENVVDSTPEEMPRPPQQLNPIFDSPPVEKIAAANRLTNLRWTEISGLLAQRNELPETSGSGRVPTWSRIAEAPRRGNDNIPVDQLALRTLPFSRAEGAFDQGGRIVLAGDTNLQISRGDSESSAQFDLTYGSFAMLNLPQGTEVRLQHGDRRLATLRWRRNSSVVVHRQAAGLQLQIAGGPIEIDDQPVDESALRIADDRSIEPVASIKRLPRWVSRPDESTAADRMILAQMATTNDVRAAIENQLLTMARNPQLSADEQLAMQRLAHWQVAMSGANLYRWVGSRIPAVRLAALQRMRAMSESDPRYARVWALMERSLNNPQRLAQIRIWFQLIRTGARPNAVQLEQMLNGLSSPNIAGRAMSDYMLRQYIRNPPPFDPTWTGQTLQRGINLYRERAGVPIDRLRTNAAGN